MSRYEPLYVSRRKVHDAPPGVDAVSTRELGSAVGDALYAATGRSAGFARLLCQQRIDVVHAHFGPDGLYAADAARRAGIPLVVTLHGRDVTVRRRDLFRTGKPIAVNYALRRLSLSRRADLLLCVSHRLREDAIELGFPEDRLVTHYIGVDTALYRENVEEREPSIVHVARLVEKKGTAHLIDAFARIARRVPQARLLIVGEGPLGSALRQRAASTGVGARIEFLGRLSPDRVRELVGRSSVVAVPSVTASNGDREGLPIALIEAMALGTPVVATRHSGIPEAVESDAVGRLVPEHDVDALAEALSSLLEDSRLAREVGAAAAALVRERFDLATQTARLESIYDSVRR
ncbi:MAG: glycosyltransferase [Microbacterium sp.]